MGRNRGQFNFSSNYEILTKSPLDARQLVGLYSDLTGATWSDVSGNTWLYDGAIVSVSSDPTETRNGLYRLKSASGYTSHSNWVKMLDSVNGNGSGLTGIPISGVTGLQELLHTQNSDTQLKSPDGKVVIQTDNNSNLYITGNIIQSGTTWETHTNQVYTSGDTITLRDGAVGALNPGEYVGIIAKKYNNVNDGVLVFDKNGVARVGDMDTVNWTGTTQPLATREESPLNDGIAVWNSGQTRFDTISKATLPVSTATQTALDSKSDTGHTHSYLPLSGGTLTGDVYGTTFYGSGAGLTNIPASGVTGLNLDRIIYGANEAVMSSSGLTVNTGITINGDKYFISTTFNTEFSTNNTISSANNLIISGDYTTGGAYANFSIRVFEIYVDRFVLHVSSDYGDDFDMTVYDNAPIDMSAYGCPSFTFQFPNFKTNLNKGDIWTLTAQPTTLSTVFDGVGVDSNLVTSGQYDIMSNDYAYDTIITITDIVVGESISFDAGSSYNGVYSYTVYDINPVMLYEWFEFSFPNFTSNSLTVDDTWTISSYTDYLTGFGVGHGNRYQADFSGSFDGLETTQYVVKVSDINSDSISLNIQDSTNSFSNNVNIYDSLPIAIGEGIIIQFPSFTYNVFNGDTWVVSPINNYGYNKIVVNNGGLTATNIITSGLTATNIITSGLTATNIITSGLTATNITTSGLTATTVIGGNLLVKPIEKTYSELLSLKNSNQLILGQQYVITDYRTTYTQPTTNLTMGDVGQQNENPIEQIIITANAINGFETIGKSKLYPQDIIYYNITDNTEGFTKGKIYRRIDTIQNNDIGTDWRHIKYRRYALNVTTTYESIPIGSTIPLGTVVTYTGNTNVYICLGLHYKSSIIPNSNYFGIYSFPTTGNTANSSSNITINNNILIQSPPPPTITIGVTGSTYGDYTLFSTYDSTILNNTILTYTLMNSVFITTTNIYSNKIGNNFTNNTIGGDFNRNNISNNFYSNYIGFNFNNNTIFKSFYSNKISNGFLNNIVNGNFYSNLILYVLGYNSKDNLFNGDFYENYIVGRYGRNTTRSFYNCVLEYNFYNNSVDDQFNFNMVKHDFMYNTADILFSYSYIGYYFMNNTITNRAISLDLKGNSTIVSSGVTNGTTLSVYSTTGFANSGSFTGNYGVNYTYTGITSTSINGISPVITSLVGKEVQFNSSFSELYNKDSYGRTLTKTDGNKIIIRWIDQYGDTNILKV